MGQRRVLISSGKILEPRPLAKPSLPGRALPFFFGFCPEALGLTKAL